MYKAFHIELKFRDRVFSGLPKNTEVLEAYVQSKFGSDDTSPTDTDLDLSEEVDKRSTHFRKTEQGIYIGGYQIKSMISEAASLLELTVKKRGSKQTLKEGLSVIGINENDQLTGDKVFFLPNRTKADGTYTHTGNVSTPQGNRSIIKSMEYIEQASIKFILNILENRMQDDNRGKKLTTDNIKECLAHSRELGIGSHRKYDAGKFDVVKFEEVDSSYTIDF